VAASVVVPRENPALQGIFRARPKAAFAGIEIAVVFVEQAAQPERHRALNGILTQDVRVSLTVCGRSLSPLFGLVVPLIDTCGKSHLDVSERIDHRLQIDLRSLPRCEGLELVRLLRSGHIQVVKEVVHGAFACGGSLLENARTLILRSHERAHRDDEHGQLADAFSNHARR